MRLVIGQNTENDAWVFKEDDRQSRKNITLEDKNEGCKMISVVYDTCIAITT